MANFNLTFKSDEYFDISDFDGSDESLIQASQEIEFKIGKYPRWSSRREKYSDISDCDSNEYLVKRSQEIEAKLTTDRQVARFADPLSNEDLDLIFQNPGRILFWGADCTLFHLSIIV